MSTTSATGASLRHERAGIDVALRDETVHRRRDHRVRQIDAQLVEACLRLVGLRAREIELRERGLIARLVVVQGLLRQQLTLEQAARAFDVGLGQLKVGFPLTNRRERDFLRRFGLLDLLDDLEVLDLGEALTAVHAIAEPDRELLQTVRRSEARPTTVASPMRLPTTVISCRKGRPVRLGQFDGQRAASAATPEAPAGKTPTARNPPPPRRPPPSPPPGERRLIEALRDVPR